ncbi:hypothetical protein [Streptomyces telluris]|uniref:Uncharacterized protein n=2 Tax=Streptomyces telluris TaxID=2720021 RepID=A0A9X2LMA5_9ACTN|nr:hypothetical protein [Streptomyces telluris]MCQ8773559.1 hypothetical protein [Streptomyces telluris]NJP82804.1 hypothetical protein [Streptomyces telluris]
MAFIITQGSPNPLVLPPGGHASFTIEVKVDAGSVGAGETIRVKLPAGLFFPPTGQIRYISGGSVEVLPVESLEDGGRLVRFKAKAIGIQPQGFYSINVQALPNAAEGDRIQPDGLTIGATTTAPLSFRVGPPQPVEHKVYGTVDANGNVLSGDGFTVGPGLTGAYKIIFAKLFASRPTVLATLLKGGERGAVSVESVNTGLFVVQTTTNGAPAPLGFSFIAIGLAAPNP